MKPLLFLAVCLPAVVSARIGESPEQCDKRYGKLVSADNDTRFYQSGIWGVAVTFTDGVATTITFNKGANKRLTAREVGLLLDKNRAGGEWDDIGTTNGQGHWKNWKSSLLATRAQQGDVDLLFITRHSEDATGEEALRGF